MRWAMYTVAALATVAAAFLWVFVIGQLSSASAGSSSPVVDVSSLGQKRDSLSAPLHLQVLAPASRQVTTACVDGETWAYQQGDQRWFKLSPVLHCRP